MDTDIEKVTVLCVWPCRCVHAKAFTPTPLTPLELTWSRGSGVRVTDEQSLSHHPIQVEWQVHNPQAGCENEMKTAHFWCRGIRGLLNCDSVVEYRIQDSESEPETAAAEYDSELEQEELKYVDRKAPQENRSDDEEVTKKR